MATERSHIYKYKGNLCASCGKTVQEMMERYQTVNRMFQFHHIDPSAKDQHYKRLMAQRLSRRQLDEIDKCVLLCTECHAILHAQEIKAKLELSVELDKRKVTQICEGWIRADLVDRKLTFVTNQPYLLHLCTVIIGQQAPRHLFLVEIERQDNLFEWLEQIEQHKRIEVSAVRNKKLFMHIKHIDGRQIEVTQSIGFPLMHLEFFPFGETKEAIYFRNGLVLTASGNFHSTGQISYKCTLDITPTALHDA